MRIFILRSLKGITRPFDFSEIKKTGRLDIVANCALNTLLISNDVRKDTKFIACLDGPPNQPITLIFDGSELKEIYPSEFGFLEVINECLFFASKLKLHQCKKTHNGVIICKKAWEHIVKEIYYQNFQLIYLDPEGKNFNEVELRENVAFFLGDQIGLPKKSIKFLERFNPIRVSLGKTVYFASQAITIVNYLLDCYNRESNVV